MSYANSARVTFANMLGTLDHLVGRAQGARMSDEVLSTKLTEDMFSLELQLRIALNQVLLALAQVGGSAHPLEEGTYGSLSEVRERTAAVQTARIWFVRGRGQGDIPMSAIAISRL
jgi:hypothetical protein